MVIKRLLEHFFKALLNIISSVGENSTFAGIAFPDTNPGTYDGPVFYIANSQGAYPNFGNALVVDGELAIFVNNANGGWSKKSALIFDSRSYPITLRQGTIDFGTQQIMASATRVFTKCPIDPNLIGSIALSNGIRAYTYIYSITGEYEYSIDWRSEINFTDKSKRYLLTFAKVDVTQEITPEEVYDSLTFSYTDTSVTSMLKNYYIELSGVSLEKMFVNSYFLSTTNKLYLPKDMVKLSGFACLSMPVRKGDSFTIHSITGGNNAHAYAIFSSDGTLKSSSGALAKINNTELNIEDDGYIVFNGDTQYAIAVTAKKARLSLEWVYSYVLGIATFINSTEKSNVNNVDLSFSFTRGAYFNIAKGMYIPGTETANSGYDCISLKVKAGDYFEPYGITGGEDAVRAYAIFDKYGKQLLTADPAAVLNSRIDIPEDGYIVFNAKTTAEYTLKGKFHSFNDWIWPYVAPLSNQVYENNVGVKNNKKSIRENAVISDKITYPLVVAGNYWQSQAREVINTKHIWKDGDFIKSVIIGTPNLQDSLGNTRSTQLKIYDRNKKLKQIVDLGKIEALGSIEIDISDKSITLEEGDMVALMYGWYNSKTGTDFYDIASNTVLNGYGYSFGFVFDRVRETSSEGVRILEQRIYGSYQKSESSEWDEGGYINLSGSTAYFSPISMDGWRYKVIDCSAGDIFKVHIKGGTSQARAWAFVKGNGEILSVSTSGDWIDTTLTAPEGASFLVLNANNEQSTVEGTPSIIPDYNAKNGRSKIKILCFGNSFTQDSMAYVPFILKGIAPEVELTLGIGYIGGCSLAQHLANFTGETQSVGSETYNPTTYYYHKSVNGSSWSTTAGKDVSALLSDEEWDIITFQQNGSTAHLAWENYYAPFIYKLHNSLFSKLTHRVKIGWLLTQGAYFNSNETAYSNWEGTAENAKKILEKTGTSVLFPFGTAVQNLRTTSLNTLGDGSAHNLCADNAHLQEGIGCLTAAYANALTILNCLGLGKVGVIGEKTRVDSNYVTSNNIPGPNLGTSGVIGITETNCYLAQVAAEFAVKKPYVVTDCNALYS